MDNTDASFELNLLDPKEVRLFRTSPRDVRLRLTLANERSWPHVRLSLAFPLSEPDGYIGVRDSQDAEIGLIADARTLDAESREALREELDRRYFTPKVQSFKSAVELTGTVTFVANTDRGERRFIVRSLRDSSTPIGPDRLLLVDVDGNRYDVPNVSSLDPEAYRILSKVI